MSLRIERIESASPALVAFVAAHHTELEPTAPTESRHALAFERLLAPEVRLFAAVDGEETVATGALATVDAGHEEIKSMRTAPVRRGQGLGRAMVTHLIDDAVGRGIRRLSLETGSADFFVPARALYAGAGFTETGPFGSYLADPHSVFMTLDLRTR